MKYLQLHRLIWILLILIITFIEIVSTTLSSLVYAIWNFKLSFPFNTEWKELHRGGEFPFYSEHANVRYENKTDNNIKDTIIRRYHILFK